jgi:hypothetical protein
MNALAFCLSVRGFVSPPIGQALSRDPGHYLVGALCIFDSKAGAVVIAKIELCKIAMQMLLAYVVERTDNARLKIEK